MSMVYVPKTLFPFRKYLNKMTSVFLSLGYQRAEGRPLLHAPAPRYYMPGYKVV